MKSTYRYLLVIAVLLLAGFIAIGLTPGQTATAQTEGPATEGIFRGTVPVVNFDVSPPLREMTPAEAKFLDGVEIIDDFETGFEGPLGPQDLDLIVQSAVGTGEIPDPIVSFNGPANISGVQPPDPNGDVGPNHVVVMSNLSFQIFDKAGNSLYGPVLNNTLWAGFGGPCQTENSGDPIVLHDQFNDRWILSQFTSAGPTWYNCVAISQTADPTGSYYRYAFSTGSNFPDYPKYGVWSNAYYISTREFAGGSSFAGVGAYAVEIADVISGNPTPTVISFLVPPGGTAYNVGDGLLPADIDGSTLPPSDVAYFMGSMDNGGPYGAPQDALTLWKFTPDFTTPANSSFVLANTIPITAYDTMFDACGGGRSCIPQPGTTNKIDILSYRQRPIWRLAYRNFGSHESLVTNQSVEATGGIAGNRWWEIRSPGSSPVIYQEGTYAPGTSDGIHRWMGSIAMDGSGNIAFAYSASDATSTFPSVWYTGRLAGDPLGQMTLGEASIIDGTGSQTSGQRWGDYSSLTVDPVDDCTFWAVNEWLPVSGGNWTLRIGAFKFDECGSPDFTLSVTPDSQDVCTPNDAVYTVNVGQVQGYTDPVTLSASGNPAGTTAGFSTNPVTPPGTSTLTIGNMGAAAAGSYSIDVVGVAATSTHTSTVSLDVFTAVPGAPSLVSPADGATGVSLAPTLEWSSATGGQTYAVEVATDSGFSNIVYTAGGIAGTQHTLTTGLSPLTTYYWRVQGENICGTGSYSTTFSFTTADVPPILLVDDDDNGPNVQATYTAALDALGMAYDVWDTGNTDNEPNAADLSAYDAVIWFSGDEFGGFAGPGSAGETALGTWLDAGGACLFLSSQDYHYDRDLTAFMTDYLGAATITDDNGDYTSVTGQGAVFGGLGPYTLTYPFTDFSDPITPDGTAALAFQGNNSNGAAITKETTAYKATFWVYPWEAITNAADRETTLQTFFDWCGTETTAPVIDVDPTSLSSNQAPDNVVTQTLTIANLGDADLDWSIDEDNQGLAPVSGPTTRQGTPTQQTSTITAPASVLGTIVGDGSFEGGTPNSFWTEASTNFGTPLCDTAGCGTGGGTGPHTGAWWAWFGGIATYEEGSVSQDVLIPAGVATLTFWLELPVACDSAADYLEVTIDGNQVFLIDGTSASCGVVGYALQTVDVSAYADDGTHTLAFHSEVFGTNATVTNFFVDDVAIDVSGAPAVCTAPADIPWANVTPTSGTTAAGTSDEVAVVFDTTGLSLGVYTGTLCITSNDATNPLVTVPLYLTVEEAAYGVALSGDQAETAVVGETVTYTLAVTNTGNAADTFDLSVASTWPADLSDTSVALSAGASTTIWVAVTVPAGTADGDNDVATVTATSQGDPTATDSADLTTTADVPSTYGVELSADQAATSEAGTTVTYEVTVTNLGDTTDTFDLTVTGVWTATLSETSVTLAAGASTTITVEVEVPADAVDGDSDVATVTATSQTDPTATDSANLTTTAGTPSFHVFLPLVRNDD